MPSSPSSSEIRRARVAVIGGGPAGLMAAEALAAGGVEVDLYDAMPSVGRKFLMAGKGGMNLTHSEPAELFLSRYAERRAQIEPLLRRFDTTALRAWVHGLGVETFVGSSGRVFPTDMKAAPMLRAWLHRLRGSGVRFHMRHKWLGWGDEALPLLRFATPEGERSVEADAVVLALGGASWPRLGSDAAWIPHLEARDVGVSPFKPSNCGFDIDWSEHFSSRFAGEPLKAVAIGLPREEGGIDWRTGECLLTSTGIEGSLIYAMSARIRDRLAAGDGTFFLDLLPALTPQRVHDEVTHPRGARSMSSHLQSRLNLTGVKAGLLREVLSREDFADTERLAQRIKALPLTVTRPRPIAEAISSAGGVRFESLDSHLMLEALPGVFCAGEMLDWEAPTGGYLLTACFASGLVAGEAALAYVQQRA
ncbi:TIGR03862 family flavoprotein [Burkholderia sp. S171]|uniref:TIGR03862 family flavoprotein n=1 Tax=Burkholderia sp. S171 TaxID=1641860 RepID=UPI00131E109D|nr:TIGR03862 family flavoprotein [Burkholderia sp. S171]